jgi:hypothetical protein
MKKIVFILLLSMLLCAATACNPNSIEESTSLESAVDISTEQSISTAPIDPNMPDPNEKGLSSAYDGSMDIYNGYVYVDIGYKVVRKWKDGKYEDIWLQTDVPDNDSGEFRQSIGEHHTFIKDDYVYQNGWTDHNAIYREHLSGDRKRVRLCDGRLVTVRDGWVWWFNSDTNTLGKIRINGEDNIAIKQDVYANKSDINANVINMPSFHIAIHNDSYVLLDYYQYLYNNFLYQPGGKNYRKYDLNQNLVAEYPMAEDTTWAISWNNWVFYKTDGTNGNTKIFAFPETGEVEDVVTITTIEEEPWPPVSVYYMEVVDGWLYYDRNLPLNHFYRVRVDGTGEEQLW